MLRHLSSLLYRQTSGHASVLQRATSIQVHVDAAATVVNYSLEAKLSPPVHRGV
jgi:carbon monoxide dehydrogenase subunit G